MKEPGIDDRHRDKGGRIQEKCSDAQNKNLSKQIPQFSPKTTLSALIPSKRVLFRWDAVLSVISEQTLIIGELLRLLWEKSRC
jgi:hypothetical protein